MPETRLPGTSPEYDQTEKIVRSAIFDVAFDRVFETIISIVPVLGKPVIKQVVSFISRKLLELFYNTLEEFFAKLFIDIKVSEERKAYEIARDALKQEMQKPKEEQDTNAKVKEFKDRLRILISLKP